MGRVIHRQGCFGSGVVIIEPSCQRSRWGVTLEACVSLMGRVDHRQACLRAGVVIIDPWCQKSRRGEPLEACVSLMGRVDHRQACLRAGVVMIDPCWQKSRRWKPLEACGFILRLFETRRTAGKRATTPGVAPASSRVWASTAHIFFNTPPQLQQICNPRAHG